MSVEPMQRKDMEQIYAGISPFELEGKLVHLCDHQVKKKVKQLLNAGRGNPNWIAATPREAFFALGQFAVEESRRTWSAGDLAGMPKKSGIAGRLQQYVETHHSTAGVEALERIVQYGIAELGFDPDSWVHELADGIIGDNYPVPGRMLVHTEETVKAFWQQELCGDAPLGDCDMFGVEGATAAICNIFSTFMTNRLLSPGDRIAIMVPVFVPYLEIPHLPHYQFDIVEIHASGKLEDGSHSWQYPDEELEKLKDPSIKALFVVNPSNPSSVAMAPESVEKLVQIVKQHNPNLMIITDDVYGNFVPDFRSLMTYLPYNTIGVYSYSKYLGVTGWRLGVVCIEKDNLYDRLLQELPEDVKQVMNERYAPLKPNPEETTFMERLVADSRSVALNHTAGLSTPQQVQMAIMSIFCLLDHEHGDTYKQQTIEICRRRLKLFYEGLEMEIPRESYSASYYSEFDVLNWALKEHGKEFAAYLKKTYKPLNILFRLAERSSVVLISGSGFHAPEWSVRVSLANLHDEAYPEIGRALKEALHSYVEEWKQSRQHAVEETLIPTR